MSRTVQCVGPDARLPEVERLLRAAGISAVPVVDDAQRPLGVISRTDLLAAGAVPLVTGSNAIGLSLPDRRVGDLIRGRSPIAVGLDATLADAVAKLRSERVHRVLVVEEGRLCGVVSAWDALAVVASARVARPIGRLMSEPVIALRPGDAAGVAIERLASARVRALPVVESGWPIGVFGQEEALAAQLCPEPSEVEHWLNPSVLSAPPSMPAHRAAAMAVALRAHHIVVMDLEGVAGILTATDFLELDE